MIQLSFSKALLVGLGVVCAGGVASVEASPVAPIAWKGITWQVSGPNTTGNPPGTSTAYVDGVTGDLVADFVGSGIADPTSSAIANGVNSIEFYAPPGSFNYNTTGTTFFELSYIMTRRDGSVAGFPNIDIVVADSTRPGTPRVSMGGLFNFNALGYGRFTNSLAQTKEQQAAAIGVIDLDGPDSIPGNGDDLPEGGEYTIRVEKLVNGQLDFYIDGVYSGSTSVLNGTGVDQYRNATNGYPGETPGAFNWNNAAIRVRAADNSTEVHFTNFAFGPVPEPGSLSLIGLGSLLALRRRRA